MNDGYQPPVETSVPGAPRRGALADLFPRASECGETLDHWARGRFLVEHGAPKNLEEPIAERFPTPEALAEVAPDIPVSVYGFRDPTGAQGTAAPSDRVRVLHTFPPSTIRDAVPLYHAGHTVVCWHMLEHLPEALRRCTDILESIGLPCRPMAARGLTEPWNKPWLFVVSLVYSPPGGISGLGLHFDLFDSVVVQLRGQKHWRVGRHPFLDYPVYNEETAARLDYPPSLPRLTTRPEFVGKLEDIEMQPGSVLLLPRGTYHTTLADDVASLSIGYHFTLPTWSDLMLAALERRLTRDPRMRTTPFGAFHLAGPSTEAQQGMAWAVEQVRDALSDPQQLLETDLLGNLASHHQAAFRLASDAKAQLLLDNPPAISNYGGLGVDAQLPAEASALCSWMVGRDQRFFDFNDAITAAGKQLSAQDVWNVLQECVEAGVLERHWGGTGQRPAPELLTPETSP
jgi:Cupin superfamily protein